MGWRRVEGMMQLLRLPEARRSPGQLRQGRDHRPIIEYKNCTAKPDGCKGISVTGGYVYRGSNAAWKGKYFFGDWSEELRRDGRPDLRRNQGR